MSIDRPSDAEREQRGEVAIVMLSNFGRADGGRETWAYNFIPRFLERYPDLGLRIYGFRVADEPDNREVLLGCIAPEHRHRVTLEFVEGPRNRVPNALYFIAGLRRLLPKPLPQVRLVIAVGSFVELLAVLASPAFRSAGRAVWLRSIFAAEKAHRYPPRLRGLLERVEASVLRRADLIIANGEDTAAPYRAAGLQVTVIPNATELQRWTMLPPRLEVPIQVAYIGRLTRVKGIVEFLEVARSFAQQGKALLRFHVIGEGAERRLVTAAAERGEIIYHGAIANELVPQALGSIDVCVALTFAYPQGSTSLGGAGTSNAVIEQMAAGRVLVCWDNLAFRQLLDGGSALFVKQGDVGALKKALTKIAHAPQSFRTMAESARARSQAFSLEQHLNRFAQVAMPWLDDVEPPAA